LATPVRTGAFPLPGNRDGALVNHAAPRST
jgi:hypothetical protein